MTTPTLPSNVDYGYVVGQFLLAVGDSSDVDNKPDGVAPEGLTITFTPEPQWLLNVSAIANPVTILPSEIVCTVDNEGYLLDPDLNRGVYLIATDDPDLNPTDWNYTVTFRSPDRPRRVFNINVPIGSVTDLTTVTPVAGSIGNAVVRGEVGPPGPPVDLQGHVADASALPTTAVKGQAWITDDDGHLHVWNNTAFIDMGLFRGPGLPVGGSAYQWLQKRSGSLFDYEWASLPPSIDGGSAASVYTPAQTISAGGA